MKKNTKKQNHKRLNYLSAYRNWGDGGVRKWAERAEQTRPDSAKSGCSVTSPSHPDLVTSASGHEIWRSWIDLHGEHNSSLERALIVTSVQSLTNFDEFYGAQHKTMPADWMSLEWPALSQEATGPQNPTWMVFFDTFRAAYEGK